MTNAFGRRMISAAFVTVLALGVLASAFGQKGRSIVERVHFERGRTTAVLRGTVRRGLSHDYLLGAQAGQTMTVHLASAGNLVFTILGPGGSVLADNSKDWSGELPLNGDYRINVLPDTTRNTGDAYTLEVGIR